MTIPTSPSARLRDRSPLLAGLAFVAAAACSRPAPSATAPAAGATGAPVTIELARVVEQALDVPLSLPAELAPYQQVDIRPRVSGFVRSVAVDRGSAVQAGDLLLTLDAPELVAQRAEAQSKLEAAEGQLAAAQAKSDADRTTFARLQAAAEVPGVVAGNDVAVAGKAADASGSLVAAARGQVDAARQSAQAVRDLEGYLRVTAPFAGVVTERHVHPGALVGPADGGTPLLRVVDARRLRLVVPVPEAYTSGVTRGASLPFTVAAFPGVTFTGTIARIARVVDVATRTMAVELDVANADGRLAPGAFCHVRWPVRRSTPSLFVPTASVASTTGRTFVVRVRGGRTEWVDVTTGLTAGPLVEVFGDLRAGDAIAGRATDDLRPGTAVQGKTSS